MTTTARPIARRASQGVFWDETVALGLAIHGAYGKVRSRMSFRLDSLALLLLLPPRGE
jgi:hypothetical protein